MTTIMTETINKKNRTWIRTMKKKRLCVTLELDSEIAIGHAFPVHLIYFKSKNMEIFD